MHATHKTSPDLWEIRGKGKYPSGSWHANIQIFHIVLTGYLYKLAYKSFRLAKTTVYGRKSPPIPSRSLTAGLCEVERVKEALCWVKR